MSDIVSRLRDPENNWNSGGRFEAADEIERLRAALESCEAWIDRWTKHVGECETGSRCTCGRTAILHEARDVLNNQQFNAN